MMKTLLFKKAALFVILLLISFQFSTARDNVEKQKKITKTFNLKKDTRVSIKNKFGKVHINTWDKKELKAEITITAFKKDETKAQALLDEIDVEIEEGRDEIEFITQLNKSKGKGDGSFEVNYLISMPKDNPLEVKNSFGDFYLDDFNGTLELDIAYGSLKAHKINGDAEISLSFGDGHIQSIERGELEVKYSDLIVEYLGNVELENDFSEIKIGKSDHIEIDSKYGQLAIEEVGTIEGKAGYLDMAIDLLSESLDLDIEYGDGIVIRKVAKDFDHIDIENSFAPCFLYLENGIMAELEAALEFSDLKFDEKGIIIHEMSKEGFLKEYRGEIGKIIEELKKAKIIINSSYGDVKLKVLDQEDK